MRHNQREFARVNVDYVARIRPLDEEQRERLRVELALGPSVWVPSSESALRDMVSRSVGTTEAVLAQAILDISEQIVRLRARLDRADAEPSYESRILQLSGGGGRIRTDRPLESGESLGLTFEDQHDCPLPIRCVVEVVRECDEPRSYGFRLELIHPQDRDRLIYMIQRREMRRAHTDEEPVTDS